MNRRALHWFRRDLRLADNTALATAMAESDRVFCVFVFDTEILDALPSRADRRVEFIWHSLAELEVELVRLGGSLIVLHGRAREEIPGLASRLDVATVFANHDYEPAAIDRDRTVRQALSDTGIAFHTCKDQVIFEKDELLSGSGRPYTVFSPYRTAWLKKLPDVRLDRARTGDRTEKLAAAGTAPDLKDRTDLTDLTGLPDLSILGFETTNLLQLGFQTGASGARAAFEDFLPRMDRYHQARDFPGLRGVSYLSVHLRFGTISIRTLVGAALNRSSEGANAWLDELIWRDFYFSILYQFPHVVAHPFRRELDRLPFTNRPDRFAAWCRGRTGFPLVDAAMRQLNSSGYMHNRLRMLTASFLVKDLHVDWRWGERYFAARLNDYDLAANNGGWQWAASTGNDAQPWFRVFNPVLQSKRFDPDGRFIRKYITELADVATARIHEPWRMSETEQQACGVLIGKDYPAPIVDHATARKEVLAMFESAKRPKDGTGS